MTHPTLLLRRPGLELILAPEAGGSIARFDHVAADGSRMPILRGAATGESDTLAMGSFPLVPYSNRIREGRFKFRGREVRIAPNMGTDPSPLHGDGWRSSWTVESHSDDQAVLSYTHAPGEWPWAYRAEQHFTLDDAGASVRLSCRNLAEEPMPCGLGQHPYFPCAAGTMLDTQVSHVWTIDDRVLPVEKIAATARYNLRTRLICGQGLDNGFSGWRGEAWIRDPGWPFAVRLSSPDSAFFQVYSPAEGRLFAAEPVSHANAALNEPEERWPELGIRILEAGEEMALHMHLDVALDDGASRRLG
jgi:aldose 1-epimerase